MKLFLKRLNESHEMSQMFSYYTNIGLLVEMAEQVAVVALLRCCLAENYNCSVNNFVPLEKDLQNHNFRLLFNQRMFCQAFSMHVSAVHYL